MEYKLLSLSDIDESLEEQARTLFLQLNDRIKTVSLQEVLSPGSNVDCAICTSDGIVAGMAFLARYKSISGYKAMVEDVVVDERFRKKGIGRQLMQLLLVQAREKRVSQVLLYTAYHRAPAMALYESLGFKKRESNVYQLFLGE